MLAQQRFGLPFFAALALLVAITPASAQSGWIGGSYNGNGEFTYIGSATFDGTGSNVIHLFGSNGSGFDAANFQIFSNGNMVDSHSFNNVDFAKTFFSDDSIDAPWVGGIELKLTETLHDGEGFGFNYGVASAVPEPSTYTMMLIGFVGLGLMAYRRHRKIAHRVS